MTEAWLTKTLIAPAMKKAGTRQRSTWSRAYSCSIANDSRSAPRTRRLSIGRKRAAANAATIQKSLVRSFIACSLVFPPRRLGDLAKPA